MYVYYLVTFKRRQTSWYCDCVT